MISLFLKGGLIMWPILLASLIALTVVLERLFFVLRTKRQRQPEVVSAILANVEHGDMAAAIHAGQGSRDFVARTLTYALEHRERSLSAALLRSASRELDAFNRGLPVLDTIVTLAPLLGLLGTVVGMIHSFGLLGGAELGAPQAITGGIAEALIATGFGLGVAILALIPLNALNSLMERSRLELQDAATHLELFVVNRQPAATGPEA